MDATYTHLRYRVVNARRLSNPSSLRHAKFSPGIVIARPILLFLHDFNLEDIGTKSSATASKLTMRRIRQMG